MLTHKRKSCKKRYLHIVSYKDLDEENDDDDDEIEGKIKVLKSQLKSRIDKLENSMKKQNE